MPDGLMRIASTTRGAAAGGAAELMLRSTTPAVAPQSSVSGALPVRCAVSWVMVSDWKRSASHCNAVIWYRVRDHGDLIWLVRIQYRDHAISRRRRLATVAAAPRESGYGTIEIDQARVLAGSGIGSSFYGPTARRD